MGEARTLTLPSWFYINKSVYEMVSRSHKYSRQIPGDSESIAADSFNNKGNYHRHIIRISPCASPAHRQTALIARTLLNEYNFRTLPKLHRLLLVPLHLLVTKLLLCQDLARHHLGNDPGLGHSPPSTTGRGTEPMQRQDCPKPHERLIHIRSSDG